MLLPTRVGLGTLRLADAASAGATVHSALDAGLRVFDTARAYGDVERWLAAALAHHAAGAHAFIITKGGMTRPEGAWRADGRASTLRRDCEASLTALGRAIDLYLVHAPDPRVAWSTTVRALARIAEEKLARAVGVCNVTLAQLDEALALAPIAAVQVSFSLVDDLPLRSGVLARCRERGLALIAHSPLGGPRRARKLVSTPLIDQLARKHGVAPAAIALTALLDPHANVAVIPGARSPAAAREVAAAMQVQLDDDDRTALSSTYASVRATVNLPATPTAGEVLLVMGLPGAGKSAAAQAFVADGYERLNRDELGGTLPAIAARLEALLAASARRVVLDNTYLTRAARAQVLAVAARHGVAVRGIFIDVPMADAQVNVVRRMLATHGRLLPPEELRRGDDNTRLTPTALYRLERSLERPTPDEGFTALELRPFVRASSSSTPGALVVALDIVDRLSADDARAAFVIGWAPDAPPTLEAELTARHAGAMLCRHGGGPPICWCRPPLPGLMLALAHAHAFDPTASEVRGSSRAHLALATAVGARFVEVCRLQDDGR